MDILLISGNTISRYVDRIQKEVYEVNWEELTKQNNLLQLIESIRLGKVS